MAKNSDSKVSDELCIKAIREKNVQPEVIAFAVPFGAKPTFRDAAPAVGTKNGWPDQVVFAELPSVVLGLTSQTLESLELGVTARRTSY